ncbi:hypothetical protein QJS66_11690 [Kocuria rhizophila]|nr:hypothetical protein QJS66_11690 [Kocuria rhizophila]
MDKRLQRDTGRPANTVVSSDPAGGAGRCGRLHSGHVRGVGSAAAPTQASVARPPLPPRGPRPRRTQTRARDSPATRFPCRSQHRGQQRDERRRSRDGASGDTQDGGVTNGRACRLTAPRTPPPRRHGRRVTPLPRHRYGRVERMGGSSVPELITTTTRSARSSAAAAWPRCTWAGTSGWAASGHQDPAPELAASRPLHDGSSARRTRSRPLNHHSSRGHLQTPARSGRRARTACCGRASCDGVRAGETLRELIHGPGVAPSEAVEYMLG